VTSGFVDATIEWRRFVGRTPRHELDAVRPARMSDDEWNRYTSELVRPLAELIRRLDPAIVGLSGPPGSGKSTLARVLAPDLGPHALPLSMDDFYLTRDERDAKGLEWRGGPGSHDLDRLMGVLREVREGRVPFTIPRYDQHADDRGEPERVDATPLPLIIDGWFLGYAGNGYGEIGDHLDLLVFIDIDIATARERRFSREEQLREAGGGFSEEQMRRFWDEVLAPRMGSLVATAKDAADLVLVLDRDERVRSVALDVRRGDIRDALTKG
jgi:pantothenate kinase